MTRDDIKRKARRCFKGLLLEAYHEARRHAAAGKLGTTAAGEWLERFEREGGDLIDEAVDETAEAAVEACRSAATVKTVAPDAKAIDGPKAATPMKQPQPQRTGT